MPTKYEKPEDLWENGIEHPKARPLMMKIAKADTDTDWKTGGDGDNDEQLILALSSVFRAEDREKCCRQQKNADEAQVGERLTSNQNVAGSIPVIRTVAGSGVGFQNLTVNQVVGSSILLGHPL